MSADAPLMRACIALAHAQWMEKQGVSAGMPAEIAAPRAMLGLSGARVLPKMTFSTVSDGMLDWCIVALITDLARSRACNDLKTPPKLPMGVRAAATTKTSVDMGPLLVGGWSEPVERV